MWINVFISFIKFKYCNIILLKSKNIDLNLKDINNKYIFLFEFLRYLILLSVFVYFEIELIFFFVEKELENIFIVYLCFCMVLFIEVCLY